MCALLCLQTKVFDMKTALEGRIQRAEEIANTLKHFKQEVALAAEHSKSGKPISQKLLADMEAKGGPPALGSNSKPMCCMHVVAAAASTPPVSQGQSTQHSSRQLAGTRTPHTHCLTSSLSKQRGNVHRRQLACHAPRWLQRTCT